MTPKVVTIHQPEFMPWLGFFDKMAHADEFVILDTVPFRKNYFQNRNRIPVKASKQGWIWLTVPVRARHGQPINEVAIDNTTAWGKKIWKTMEQTYAKAPFFNAYKQFLRETFLEKKWNLLQPLNLELITYLKAQLQIKTPLVLASDIKATGMKSQLLASICAARGASTYLAGQTAKQLYLDETPFKQNGIAVIYHSFSHPTYQQLQSPFVTDMSVIDLLCNKGDNALKLFHTQKTHP
ncbi:MAG: hypothetical protein A2666_04860 [Parcubacteria group bacterium RIFCSPHIGHO2_01_FULL_47_10b]|nr:MAG: hypothetical protein A2666_04860 [Parcubacteria group bacterium RIFCSPHIGHO2_01_FULL_47_10b]